MYKHELSVICSNVNCHHFILAIGLRILAEEAVPLMSLVVLGHHCWKSG